MTSLSCFIHSAYCCFIRRDMGECCKRNSLSLEPSLWETAAVSFCGGLGRLWKNKIQHCNEKKKREQTRKHQVISQSSTVSRVKDLEKHTWFSRAAQGRVTAVLSQVKEDYSVVSWPQEHYLASPLLLPPFLLPYLLSLDHLASGGTLHVHLLLFSSWGNTEGQMDGWRGWKNSRRKSKQSGQH